METGGFEVLLKKIWVVFGGKWPATAGISDGIVFVVEQPFQGGRGLGWEWRCSWGSFSAIWQQGSE